MREMRGIMGRIVTGLLGGAAVAMLAGCGSTPGVNPWQDETLPASAWSTPSREGVIASGVVPVVRQRQSAASAEAPRAADEVAHFPLWWEDPFEDKGDGDKQFAWTYADYLGMPYVLGRFLLNTMAWPVSAVVTPPGTHMVSDGELSKGCLGYDHDAARGEGANPTFGPADFPVSPACHAEGTARAPQECDLQAASASAAIVAQ